MAAETKHGAAALSCGPALLAAGSVSTTGAVALTATGTASAAGVRTVTGSSGKGTA